MEVGFGRFHLMEETKARLIEFTVWRREMEKDRLQRRLSSLWMANNDSSLEKWYLQGVAETVCLKLYGPLAPCK